MSAEAVAEYRAQCAEVIRLEKLASALHYGNPGLSQGYKQLAAEAEKRAGELKADLEKTPTADLTKRLRDAVTEGLAPLRGSVAQLRAIRESVAPAPPLGMPTRARPSHSTGVHTAPVRKSPESMPPAERAAYYRKMADLVQDRSARQGYLEKAAAAEKEG